MELFPLPSPETKELEFRRMVHRFSKEGWIKVPQEVYQVMFDMGLAGKHQSELIKVLNEWAKEAYPGRAVIDSVEVTLAHAKILYPYIGHIDFGVYVLLDDSTSMQHLSPQSNK